MVTLYRDGFTDIRSGRVHIYYSPAVVVGLLGGSQKKECVHKLPIGELLYAEGSNGAYTTLSSCTEVVVSS